jgi:subtilisin family serine protease
MKKLFIVFFAVFLASCGDDKAAVLSSNELTTASLEGTAPTVSLQSVLAGAENGPYREGEIIVKLKSGVRKSFSLPAHQALGAKVLRRLSLLNADHVKLPQMVSVKDAIIRYMQDPDVEYAEPNYIRSVRSTVPDDPLFKLQWELRNTFSPGVDISMTSAWDIIRGNSGLVVAVIDSGIDYTHPDLAGNIWANPGEPSCSGTTDNDLNGFKADCRGWNFVSDNNNPMDDNGHGSHVSGTIGAVGNNGRGIAGMIWDVKIMPLKILDNEGIGTVADEASAIEYAIAKGARIINASFAGNTFSNVEFNAIKAANVAGIVFVTAAGNGDKGEFGSNNDAVPVYPGNYVLPNIISVAATDANDHIASFSNYGPNTVHVAAPGVLILSTVPPALPVQFCGLRVSAGYEYCDGTSMAAPHVTGLAGLILSYYTGLVPSQLRAMIMRYVDTLPSLQGIIRSGGRINAYKAISSVLSPSGLSANAGSATQAALTWNDNATGEDGYKIERKVAGGDFAEIAGTGPNITTFTDGGLSPSTQYTYRVRAFNVIPVASAYSNEASVTTLPGPTPTPTPTPTPKPSSGGGGGCSVGRWTHAGDPDMSLILLPIVAIWGAARARRRKK